MYEAQALTATNSVQPGSASALAVARSPALSSFKCLSEFFTRGGGPQPDRDRFHESKCDQQVELGRRTKPVRIGALRVRYEHDDHGRYAHAQCQPDEPPRTRIAEESSREHERHDHRGEHEDNETDGMKSAKLCQVGS